jgi:hypothetical protein
MCGDALWLDISCMSRLLFNRVATTVLVVLAAGLGEQSARAALGNSRDNSAVLAMLDIAPGDSRSETVTITNQIHWTARR